MTMAGEERLGAVGEKDPCVLDLGHVQPQPDAATEWGGGGGIDKDGGDRVA